MFDTDEVLDPVGLANSVQPTRDPIPDPQPLPRVQPALDRIKEDDTAKQVEQMGQGIRAMLGMGAIALLPDLIDDLRRARDPDTRIKFVQLALKEGGFGVKDNKNDNLPVFNFTFNGVQGAVSVAQPQQMVEEVTPVQKQVNKLSTQAWINDDVAAPETPLVTNVFDQIVV